MLAETRAGEDVDERDFRFYTMADWATTELVLSTKSCESFQKATGADAASAIDEGTKKIDSALGSVVRRMEAIERQAQARHAATEARMGQMESTLATVATSVSNVVGRVEDLGRALFIGQQDAHLSIDLSRVDNDIALARRTIDHPINEDEAKEATADYMRLKAKRAEIMAKLESPRPALLSPRPLFHPATRPRRPVSPTNALARPRMAPTPSPPPATLMRPRQARTTWKLTMMARYVHIPIALVAV
ncbi:hypothetical protein B0H14DRAFT_3469371 [Mycena olivaceomarginata]|nr:hypothetical protein B0H14DRAFT_3469371 [Mycena olivaceomarginata]